MHSFLSDIDYQSHSHIQGHTFYREDTQKVITLIINRDKISLENDLAE